MMRGIAILLGLLLGLAAAAVAAGRVAHLRQAEFLPLPDWTTGLTDQSGVLSGSWDAPPGGWPVSQITWSHSGTGLSAVSYAATAQTPGGGLDAALEIGPGTEGLILTLDQETLDLSRLIAGADALGLRGLLVIDRLEARFAVPGIEPVEATGSGRIVGFTLHGANLGDAVLTVAPDGATGWTGEIIVDGTLAGTLKISGLYDRPALRIDGTLTHTAPLPSALRGWLERFASEADGAWAISAGSDARLLLANP